MEYDRVLELAEKCAKLDMCPPEEDEKNKPEFDIYWNEGVKLAGVMKFYEMVTKEKELLRGFQ